MGAASGCRQSEAPPSSPSEVKGPKLSRWGVCLGDPTRVLGLSARPSALAPEELAAAYHRSMRALNVLAVESAGAGIGANDIGDEKQRVEWIAILGRVVEFAYHALRTPALCEALEGGPAGARLVGVLSGLAVQVPNALCPLCPTERKSVFPEAAWIQECPEQHGTGTAYFTTARDIGSPAIKHLWVPADSELALANGATNPVLRSISTPRTEPKPHAQHATPAQVLKKAAFDSRPDVDHLRRELELPPLARNISLAQARERTAEECWELGIDTSRCDKAPARPADWGVKRARSSPQAKSPGRKRARREADGPEDRPATPASADPDKGADAEEKALPKIEPFWESIDSHDVVDLKDAMEAWSAPDFFKRKQAQHRAFLDRHFRKRIDLPELPQMNIRGVLALVVLLARMLNFPEIDPTQVRGEHWTEEAVSNEELVLRLRRAVLSVRKGVATSVKEEAASGPDPAA